MHDQHDDPLERELSRLSQYTGEPTSLWQEAIDQHQRDQQQKLWVWVRRPAPALAAASLALLVAAVALRPIGQVSPAVNARAALSDDAARNRSSDLAATPPANEPVPADINRDQLPRDITQNTKGLENFNVRSNNRQDERFAPQAGGLALGGNDTAGGIHPASPAAPAPAESGSNLASRGGVNAPGRAASGTAHPGADIARKAGAQAPDAAPPMPAMAVSPAVAAPSGGTGSGGGAINDAAGEKLAAKREGDDRKPADPAGGENKTAAIDPLEQTATVRLAVADVNRFYYTQVPELLDAKSGESIANRALADADAKDASTGINLTLRVNENRLPQVIEELRRVGNVQNESTRLISKEDRLKQIDALVAENEGVLKKSASFDKSKAAPASGAPGAATAKTPAPKPAAEDPVQLKAQDNIAKLSRRRNQIEEGGDLATLNIIAVPELQPPPTAAMPSALLAGTPVTTPLTAGAAGNPGALTDAETVKADADAAYKRSLSTTTPATTPASPGTAAPTGGYDTDPAPAPQPGKITRAAKEGWSSLGDTTADFVRRAIGTMLYWLPALAAAIAALWWWRRRAAAAVREPPPQ